MPNLIVLSLWHQSFPAMPTSKQCPTWHCTLSLLTWLHQVATPKRSWVARVSLPVVCKRVILSYIQMANEAFKGWPEPYICTVYDCIFGDSFAKITVYTLCKFGYGQPYKCLITFCQGAQTVLHITISRQAHTHTRMHAHTQAWTLLHLPPCLLCLTVDFLPPVQWQTHHWFIVYISPLHCIHHITDS